MFRAVYLPSFLLLVCLISSTIAPRKETSYREPKRKEVQKLHDTHMQRAAAKLIHMMREVILDMQRKIEAHYIILYKWQGHRRFQIGETSYDIRRRAALIRSILKQNLIWDEIKKEFLIRNRTDNPKKDYMAVKDMSRCQYESIEVDKLVHIVERYQWARLNSSNIHIKHVYPLRTNKETENEKKKSILRKQMKNINNKQAEELNKLVDKLEDVPEENLKELLKKIGDVPEKPTKNIGEMRQEGFKQVRKIAERDKKSSDDPKHPGDGFDTDDEEAWK